MTGFAGFPSGKNQYVPIPEVFFTVLLPEIEDSAELKVTLHLFWLLAQKQGNPRCVSDRELLGDRVLLRGLKRQGDPRPAEERLRQGLEQAVVRAPAWGPASQLLIQAYRAAGHSEKAMGATRRFQESSERAASEPVRH